MTYLGLNRASMGHFGETLKRLREGRGVAQEDLASAAKVSRSLIQNAERSPEPGVKRKTYIKIATALGVSPDELDLMWQEDLEEIEVPPELKEKVEAAAKKMGMNVPDFMAFLIEWVRTPQGAEMFAKVVAERQKKSRNRLNPPLARSKGDVVSYQE